jgi:hypothetical protein
MAGQDAVMEKSGERRAGGETPCSQNRTKSDIFEQTG